ALVDLREQHSIAALRDRQYIATAAIGLDTGQLGRRRAKRGVGRAHADSHAVRHVEIAGLAERAGRGPVEALAVGHRRAEVVGADLDHLARRDRIGAQRRTPHALPSAPGAQPVGTGRQRQLERAVAGDLRAFWILGLLVLRRADVLARLWGPAVL